MITFSQIGFTLVMAAMFASAHADGDPNEDFQISADSTNARTESAATPASQTVRLGDEDYLLIPAASLEADDKYLDIYFSDKVGNLFLERSASLINVSRGRVNAGFLFSEERDTVFSGSIMLDADKNFLSGVRLSFGTRGYVALLGVENTDVFGLSLGIEAELVVPLERYSFRLFTSYFYAPDILSFGDADRIFDWDLNVGLSLRESFTVYTGVRYLQMDTRPDKRAVDENVHVGVRWHLD